MRISDWSSDVCSSDLLGLLQIANDRGEIAAAHVDIDPGRRPAVLGLEHRRSIGDADCSDRPQGDLLARRSEDRQCPQAFRSEEHTSELQSLMRISYAVFCLQKTNTDTRNK